jgi:hypothetical protein
MVSSLTANSTLLEYIAIGSAFIHCCILLFKDELNFETILLLYFFVVGNLLVMNWFRGTRIHLWPMVSGICLYSIFIVFDILEEVAFYYYYLTTLGSLALLYFFGTTNNY